MVAAPVESAPVEEPPKAPTPPPPAGKLQKLTFEWQIFVPGTKKRVDFIVEATYSIILTFDDQKAAYFLCFMLLSVSCWPSLDWNLSAPTSAPQNVAVDDVNESSLTIKWKTPETIGDSGLDGYIIEYCKDGSKWRVYACVCVCVFAPVPTVEGRGQIDSWLHSGRIRQAPCHCISWDHF